MPRQKLIAGYLMKKTFLLLILSLSSSSFAGSLQQQLSAVAQAEHQGKVEEQRQSDFNREQIAREERHEKQREADAAAMANKKAALIAAEKKAQREKVEAETLVRRKRDEGYEDELRNLEIQKQKLALAREEARVKRENDFIDQELKSQAAQTDVVQSNADSNRNLSEGSKDLLKSEGKARVEKASGWFN